MSSPTNWNQPYQPNTGYQPQAKSGPNILLIALGGCGVVLLLGCGGLCGGIALLTSGHEGGVRLSNEMEPYATKYLAEHNILKPTETLVAYYDVTISLDGTEAAILTTERVIYHRAGTTTAILIADITNIRHREEALIGDVIEIESSTGVPMKIEISPFNQGRSFVNALNDTWEKSKAAK